MIQAKGSHQPPSAETKLMDRYRPGQLYLRLSGEYERLQSLAQAATSIVSVESRGIRAIASGLSSDRIAPLVGELLTQLDRVPEPDYMGVLVDKVVRGNVERGVYSILDHGLVVGIGLVYPDMIEVNLVLTTADTEHRCSSENFIRACVKKAIYAVNQTMAATDCIAPFSREVVTVNVPEFGGYDEKRMNMSLYQALVSENKFLIQAAAVGILPLSEIPPSLHGRVRDFTKLLSSKSDAEREFFRSQVDHALKKKRSGCDACTIQELDRSRREQMQNL